MMKNIFFIFFLLLWVACTKAPEPIVEKVVAVSSSAMVEISSSSAKSEIPESYRDIEFPNYKYEAPFPKDYRVEIAEGISGYIVSNRNLPLVNLTVYFEEPFAHKNFADEAASQMVGTMLRRGAGGGISPHVLDDSLEFISAHFSTGVGSYYSSFAVDCLTKDFKATLDLVQKVLNAPGFDSTQLEIVKANFVSSYERRYETPAKILSALKSKVNYMPNPRLWDANSDEYKKVKVDDIKRLSQGIYSSKRVVFALSGDVDKDSAIVMMKQFFENWKIESVKDSMQIAPLTYREKPGIYIVNKDITQANISMNQPFVKRPHEDYYPAAVASFILGGGSFTSRLMNSVRTEAGLAYTVYSAVGNDYHDTPMTTIFLQTKVETVDLALDIVYREIEKLASEGPTDLELEQAKKSIIESLPNLFDSPAHTAEIFATGELSGKKDSHYIDYVTEINDITKEQVQAMVKKYFDKNKMTISIVGPVAKMEKLKPFTEISLDSLEFRE